MRYFGSLIFIVCCLFSCTEKDNILQSEPEKWTPVVADMQIIQNMLENTHPDTRDSLSAIYIDQLLKIHQVTKEDLEKLKEALVADAQITSEFYEKITLYYQNIETEYEEKAPRKVGPSENQQ